MSIEFNCIECGVEVDPTPWCDEAVVNLRARKACHTCAFWLRHVDLASDPLSLRVDGKHMRLHSEPHEKHSQKTAVLFFDGRIAFTVKLWHQGDIPERFKSRLPDNATLARGCLFCDSVSAGQIKTYPQNKARVRPAFAVPGCGKCRPKIDGFRIGFRPYTATFTEERARLTPCSY